MGILESILGGFVGGMCTLIGVLLSNHFQEKRRKQDIALKEKEEREKTYKARPLLTIKECSGRHKFDLNNQEQLSVLFVDVKSYNKENGLYYYPEEIIDETKWYSVEWKLENIGITNIKHMYLSTNMPKYTSLMTINNKSYINIYNSYDNCNSIYYERFVEYREDFTMQICLVNDKGITSMGLPSLRIWMVDVNNNWWYQDITINGRSMSDSRPTNQGEYISLTQEEFFINREG